MTSPVESVLVALAELIDSEGVAQWSPGGAFSGTLPALAMASAPSSPDRAVTLTGYTVEDDPHFSNGTLAVQVRTRGTTDPRSTWDTAAAVFDLLQGLENVNLNGVHVAECHRQSSASMGQDSNRRWEQADNYYLRVDIPTRHRPF